MRAALHALVLPRPTAWLVLLEWCLIKASVSRVAPPRRPSTTAEPARHVPFNARHAQMGLWMGAWVVWQEQCLIFQDNVCLNAPPQIPLWAVEFVNVSFSHSFHSFHFFFLSLLFSSFISSSLMIQGVPPTALLAMDLLRPTVWPAQLLWFVFLSTFFSR